jgi:prolyl oligopeptidase
MISSAAHFKFAAELQEKQTVLIRQFIDVKQVRSWKVAATIQENVDIQAFTLFNMGFKEPLTTK